MNNQYRIDTPRGRTYCYSTFPPNVPQSERSRYVHMAYRITPTEANLSFRGQPTQQRETWVAGSWEDAVAVYDTLRHMELDAQFWTYSDLQQVAQWEPINKE